VKVCILSSYIGTDRHVVLEDGTVRMSDAIPSDAFILRGDVSIDDGNSFDHVLKLNCVDAPFVIPSAWKTSMRQLLGNRYDERSVPWSKVVPNELYVSILKKFVVNLLKVIPTLDVDYYRKTYRKGNELLRSLQRASIDASAIDSVMIDANDAVKRSLETFRPVDGLVPAVEYNRLSTKTGRLTVASGPNVLTLRREHRGLLRSSFSPGAIAYIDFVSLEARALLSTVRRHCYVRDIYTWLKDVEFGGRYERSTMKLAVLSTLFGASQASLERALGSNAVDIIDAIKRRFDIEALNEKLSGELSMNGKIRNFYGRAVIPDNPKDVINHYVQSTGVDVALLGFNEFVKKMSLKNVELKPLFVLHDALIVDVGKSAMNELKRVAREGILIPGMSNVFYVSVSRLDEHPDDQRV
jgi:hypothetical protein